MTIVPLEKLAVCARLCKVAAKFPGEIAFVPSDVRNIYPYYYDSSAFSREHVQAYMWVNETRVYLAFHNNIMDHRSRLVSFEKELSKPPLVHAGFNEQFISLENHILHDLQKHERIEPFFEINVCGYAFGGAVATIAAAFLGRYYSEANPSIEVNCYTFGSPRAGNKAFVRSFARSVNESFRLTFPNEPVEKIPCLGYKHVGKKAVIDRRRVRIAVSNDIPLPFRLFRWSFTENPSFNIDSYISCILSHTKA